MLFSELRESSVAEETSLLGDGGMGLLLLLLLYGSAGCIIAPDGGMLPWSPLLWEEEMEYFFAETTQKKRETDEVQKFVELRNFDLDGRFAFCVSQIVAL